MSPSRFLPTAAFGVAVSFFFVPPLLAAVGALPGEMRPKPRLEVTTVPEARLPPRRMSRAEPIAAQCRPEQDTTLQKQPWRAWVVADLARS